MDILYIFSFCVCSYVVTGVIVFSSGFYRTSTACYLTVLLRVNKDGETMSDVVLYN